ncbi:lipid A deacylase LpxR family protein [Eionea flava]
MITIHNDSIVLPLKKWWLAFLSLPIIVSAASADVDIDESLILDDSKGAFSFAIENDLFGSGTDRHYTNGFQLAYVSDTYHPRWIEKIADFVPFYRSSDNVRFGFAFGQSIFTPDNISEPNLIIDDRPYAGWLYTTFSLTSDRRVIDWNVNSTKNNEGYRYANALDITVGIVGPSALAEQTQTQFHEWVDTTTPRGWNNQLKDEFGLNIAYTRLWQYPLGRNIDVTPQAGFSIGNVYTFANAGLMLRWGNSLGQDFGPPLIRPSAVGSNYFTPKQSVEWYLFAGASGRYVERDIFLDGNTHKDSHSVEKKDWVGDIQVGAVLNVGDVQFGITQIYRTREFKQQQEPNRFGALNVIWRY